MHVMYLNINCPETLKHGKRWISRKTLRSIVSMPFNIFSVFDKVFVDLTTLRRQLENIF